MIRMCAHDWSGIDGTLATMVAYIPRKLVAKMFTGNLKFYGLIPF